MKEFLKAYSPNKEEMNELHPLKNLLQPPVVRAGVGLCILISLVAGSLLGNGKLTVFLVILRMGLACIAGCIFLTRCRKYPGGFPTALIMLMFGLITPCTFFTHSLPQVFPDNANVGTFCSKFICQERMLADCLKEGFLWCRLSLIV